ncbi:MAG: hypothetical protein IKY31_07765 [Bacteroidaceae bacterium]|nr:hypothetical protein [Bacteroidaceae bacterium]
MKKSFIFIATMFAMTACFSDNMATNDSVSVANADTIIASNKEYLDIKTTIFEDMDKEDHYNVDEALARLTLTMTRDENDLVHFQEYHNSLNMSRTLYNYVNETNERGNKFIEERRKSPTGGF